MGRKEEKELIRRRNTAKFRNLCKETNEVARLYFKALDASSLRNGHANLNMAHTSMEYRGSAVNKLYVAKIEAAFKSLDLDSRRIINNDFFFNNYKFWWVELYSTSTYYRLKRTAICKFLDSLE